MSANAALAATGHELWGHRARGGHPARLDLAPRGRHPAPRTRPRRREGAAAPPRRDRHGRRRPREARHPPAPGDPPRALRSAEVCGRGHRGAGPGRRGGPRLPTPGRLPLVPQGGRRLRARRDRAGRRVGPADRPAVLHGPRRGGRQRPCVRQQMPPRPPHQGLPGRRLRPGRPARGEGQGPGPRFGRSGSAPTTTPATSTRRRHRPTAWSGCCCPPGTTSTSSSPDSREIPGVGDGGESDGGRRVRDGGSGGGVLGGE